MRLDMHIDAIRREFAQQEERIGALLAEVSHYTAGTPHPLEARVKALREELKRIAHVDEFCGGGLSFEEMAKAAMRTAGQALLDDSQSDAKGE
jgi:hypothetical protein